MTPAVVVISFKFFFALLTYKICKCLDAKKNLNDILLLLTSIYWRSVSTTQPTIKVSI
jgi:hypothetical protein